MSADPAVIAMMNQSAETFRTVDLDLCRYLASIAAKLEAGLDLTPDETTIAESYTRAAAADAETAQLAGQSTAALSAASTITLSLSSAEAAALAVLLTGQTDPVLVGIGQNLAAAQSASSPGIPAAPLA